jgi:hypothetical protein
LQWRLALAHAKPLRDREAAKDGINLCGPCALCGEFPGGFTTEDTEGTEKIGNERESARKLQSRIDFPALIGATNLHAG